MPHDKWTDDKFLDHLRSEGDDLADDAVIRLHRENGVGRVNEIFHILRSDHQALPEDAPAAFQTFMAATDKVPGGFEVKRLNRGVEVFNRHVFAATVILLASSLPSGYSAPCLSRVLAVSNNLGSHPYRRLMGVLQMVVNVSSTVTTAEDGRSHLTARKLRLLHAGIRSIIPRHLPAYRAEFGEVCNHEDMLGTIMGFSYLVIDGLQRLGLGLTEEEAEDYFYLWRHFAQMMGVHPPDQPESSEYVPASVAEAAAFYRSYARRNYAPAAENPEGVSLSKVNLELMTDLIPKNLRRLGLGEAPRTAMQELLGPVGMLRVGIQPLDDLGHHRRLFDSMLHMVEKLTGEIHHHFLSNFGLLIFQRMIKMNCGGEVQFIVPDTLEMDRKEL